MTNTVVALVGALLLFALARRWELDGRPDRYVALVVAFLLVECLLYPVQSDVPTGLFRISAFGGSLRTLDLVVAVGVLGRFTARPLPARVSATGIAWTLSCVWLATAAARGLLVGHDTNLVLFSTGSLVGLFGSALLVSGCDPARLVALLRAPIAVPLGVLVLFLIVNEASDDPPTYLGSSLGVLHVDTASVFLALGIFVVLTDWATRRRHHWAAWAALPLLATPFTIEQRATLVQLGVTVLVVVWAMTQPAWRGQIHLPRAKLLQGALAVVAVALVVLVVQLRNEADPPFAGYYEATFTSEIQVTSAQARLDSQTVGIDEWSSAWLYGHGLGHTYRIVRSFGGGLTEPETFDNTPLDLLVRSGALGLLLCGTALALTCRDGIRAWRRHPDGTIAALALAAVAVLVGLFSKSLFESILEKGKLAVLIGLCAGTIAAAVRSLPPPSPRPRRALGHTVPQGETTAWT